MQIFFVHLIILVLATPLAKAEPKPQNVILFVADGLRYGSVTKSDTPSIFKVMTEGVQFSNTHSMFPTLTTPNASALSTGHKIGDTGIYGNVLYTGTKEVNSKRSLTPHLDKNSVLEEFNLRHGGDLMNQVTLMKGARKAGYSTASIGKVGPTFLFDPTEGFEKETIIIDDLTGQEGGVPLKKDIEQRILSFGLSLKTPERGENNFSGDYQKIGTLVSNKEQQDYFIKVATDIVLPIFKERQKPFFLVYWSRDPDGTEHHQGDSLHHYHPGVNGPTTKRAIHNADQNLGTLLARLKELDLETSTNLIVVSDHGMSTISKESASSYSASLTYDDVPPKYLPPGFVAIDLSHKLDLPLYDPDNTFKKVIEGQHPVRGNALLGEDPKSPKVIIAANGGSDLLYLPNEDHKLLHELVRFLSNQDYVSGLFVADTFGPIPGTLPFSKIDLTGSAVIPSPSLIINFRSFSTGCANPVMCSVVVSDTKFQQGQGMHGSFSRADTFSFGAARGPNFKRRYVDSAPVNNADFGETIRFLLNLKVPQTGTLKGRILTEALRGGSLPKWKIKLLRSTRDEAGHETLLSMQVLGKYHYYDAAGYHGRTVGLP